MTPDETKDLALLLSQIPGVKGIEYKDVKRLVELLRESPEIGSLELRGFFGTGVVITRTGAGSPQLPAAFYPPPPLPTPTTVASLPPSLAQPSGETPKPTAQLKEIKSPMVGTFYASPEPGAAPYAKVGSRVSSGQTVCIVEAMKIMNEIEAEVAGVVKEVCVEDAQPVEFGQVLFRVDPNG